MCLKRARSEGSSVSRLDEPDTGADVSPSSHASDPMACAVGNRGHLRWRCCAPQTEPARGCGAARLAPTTQGAKRRTFGAAHRKRKAKRRRGSAPNRRPLLRALPGDEAAGGGIASESTSRAAGMFKRLAMPPQLPAPFTQVTEPLTTSRSTASWASSTSSWREMCALPPRTPHTPPFGRRAGATGAPPMAVWLIRPSIRAGYIIK